MSTPDSLTGQYLSGKRAIEVPDKRTAADPERQIRIVAARGNNLKGIDASIRSSASGSTTSA
jgi:excinuclease ABC subunit A